MTAFKDAAGVSGTQYGSSLLRFGFAENWELRIGWDGYLDSEGASGGGDGLLGIKYYLMPEAKGGFQPEMALLVHTSLPIGSDDWTSDKLDPNFLFAFSHTLSEKLSLGYNLGAKLETSENENDGDSTLASGLYSVALGYGASDRLGFFVEVFGEAGFSSDDAPATFNGGVTWLFNDDSQLDLFAGVGLNEDADDWFAGVGYSVRWGW